MPMAVPDELFGRPAAKPGFRQICLPGGSTVAVLPCGTEDEKRAFLRHFDALCRVARNAASDAARGLPPRTYAAARGPSPEAPHATVWRVQDDVEGLTDTWHPGLFGRVEAKRWAAIVQRCYDAMRSCATAHRIDTARPERAEAEATPDPRP